MLVPESVPSDRVLVALRDRGHAIFFVGDPFEEEGFRNRYPNPDAVRQFDSGRIPDVGYGFVAANLTPRAPAFTVIRDSPPPLGHQLPPHFA
jgi:hypothetical protein